MEFSRKSENINDMGSISSSTTLGQGKRVLDCLKKNLQSLPSIPIVATWLQQLEDLHKYSYKRVIVGVVGATGSGKSSVINALLGEKQLIPTNCMRACTAVVTEISYNFHSDGPLWRAKIEFISKAEWRKELELLLGDVEDDSDSISDDESEAGIAFAKIRAVYPYINKTNIRETTVEELLQTPEVNDYLGTELEYTADKTEELYTKLNQYIDSKEKLGPEILEPDLGTLVSEDSMEHWPLIRKVCIQGKNDVLQSGCVLVDLPGIADSNTARAAVSKNYIKNCAALWVVAPIIRAPDEKAARYLLGEAFRRQLHRDGTLNRLTFICSKTDELVIREVRSTLVKYPRFAKGITVVDKVKAQLVKDRKAQNKAFVQARRSFDRVSGQHARLCKDEQLYTQLKALALAGKTVHPPMSARLISKKRRASPEKGLSTPVKKSRLDSYFEQASQPSGSDNRALLVMRDISSQRVAADESSDLIQDTSKPAIAIDKIDAKLRKLGEDKKAVRDRMQSARDEKDKCADDLEELKLTETDLLAREWLECVRGRNQYAFEAIRKDFADGLTDMDRKNLELDCEEGNEASRQNMCGGEPTNRLPPSELPIFCVSSHGFQKLHGQLEGEQSTSLFSEEADTGIPALQNHAISIGRTQMATDEKAFLNEAGRLLTSIRLWSSGTGDKVAAKSVAHIIESAKNEIGVFLKAIKQSSTIYLSEVEQTLQTHIFNVLPRASTSARNMALIIVDRWIASPRAEAEPGLWYATFKAIIRRGGTYANNRKSYDFGSDLLEPLMNEIDSHWTLVFNNILKDHFQSATDAVSNEMQKFKKNFAKHLTNKGASGRAQKMFWSQASRFESSVVNLLEQAQGVMETEQKEVSRLLVATVEEGMRPIYNILSAEYGRGCYGRMKILIKQHVDRQKDIMFAKAADLVQARLEQIIADVKGNLGRELDAMAVSFRRDCVYIISDKARDFQALREVHQKTVLTALAQGEAGFEVLVPVTVPQNAIDPALYTQEIEMAAESMEVDEPAGGSDASGVSEEEADGMDLDEMMDDDETDDYIS